MKTLSYLLITCALPVLALSAAVSARASGGEKAASYEVPVPEFLRAYATYAMEPVDVKTEGLEMEVRYELPLALTGTRNELRFRGLVGATETHLRGNYGGEMICRAAENACKVKYQELEIDAARAETVLRALNLTEEAVAKHLEVTARFGDDMEGVIHFAPGSAAFRSYFAPAN